MLLSSDQYVQAGADSDNSASCSERNEPYCRKTSDNAKGYKNI